MFKLLDIKTKLLLLSSVVLNLVLLYQVFFNSFSDALKYAEEKGKQQAYAHIEFVQREEQLKQENKFHEIQSNNDNLTDIELANKLCEQQGLRPDCANISAFKEDQVSAKPASRRSVPKRHSNDKRVDITVKEIEDFAKELIMQEDNATLFVEDSD